MLGGVVGVVLEEEGNVLPERVFRDRLDPLNISDNKLLRYYRLPRRTIIELCDVLEPSLGRATARCHAIPVPTQVLISLRFLASGTFQSVLGDMGGVSQSSCSRIFRTFCSAMCDIAPQHIIFPLANAGLMARIKSDFYNIRQMPNVIGAIDGTHINIKTPSVDEPNYVNRYSSHSLNIQGICESNLRIMNVIVQWPGSTHDSFIWRQSQIKQRLDGGVVPTGYLIGDGGYPLERYLLTPVRNPGTEPERRYNASQMSTRCCIERCFGVLKSRFRCLDESGGTLMYSPQRAQNIIVAACVLHNWCVERNIPLLVPLIIQRDELNNDVLHPVENVAGAEIRRHLIATRFA